MSFSASCTVSERMFPAIGRKLDEKHVRKPFVWKELSAVALQAFRYLAAIGACHRNDNPPWSGTAASFRKDCRRWSAAFSDMYRTQCPAERSERPTARIIRDGRWHHQRRFHVCPEFPPRLSAIVSATMDVSGDTCRVYADGAVPLASSVDCQPRYGSAGGAIAWKRFGRLGTRLCEPTWGGMTVEAAGIEPASRSGSAPASTCVACFCGRTENRSCRFAPGDPAGGTDPSLTGHGYRQQFRR
jgi:hypothetical protein